MATETRTPAYAPIVVGEWQWCQHDEEQGHWNYVLTHDLLLTGTHDAATCRLLKAGTTLAYAADGTHQTVITGAYWQPLPPLAVLADVVGGKELLDELRADQQAARDAVSEKVPF